MRRKSTRGMCGVAILAAISAGPLNSLVAQTRILDTPSLIQDGFGPGGYDLRGDGAEYCGPTMANIMLGYLANQGFTQILPENPGNNDYLNLERIMIGLSSASFTSGANWDNVQTAITMYLNARGIQNLSFQSPDAPDLAFFANAQTDPYTAIGLNVQWLQRTTATGNNYNDIGGHFIGVSGADAGSGVLVLSNPMPSSLFTVADVPQNNPQFAETIPFTGEASGFEGDYLQFNYNQANSSLSNTTTGAIAVIAEGYSLSIHPNELPVGAWMPSTWTLTAATNQFTFNNATFEVLAPLAGNVGIKKDGNGLLLLRNSNSTTGSNTLDGGTVRSTSNSSMPLGSGSLQLQHASVELLPDGSSPGDVIQTLAGGSGSGLTYTGGSRLFLNGGANSSYTVNIGDAARTKAQNFARSGSGTFVLQLGNGLGNLGGSTQVYISGSGNLVQSNGMLQPNVIGADSDGSGSFLTYGASGFAVVAGTSSSSTGIASASSSTIYDLVNNQSVAADAIAAVHALRVGSGFSVSGGNANSELQVGAQAVGSEGGVILNQGGTIEVASLQFGSGNALVYSAGLNNSIASNITAAQLTKFGTGDLHLSGNNQISNLLVVESGTLHLEGTGTPSGNAGVNLGTATLVVHSGVAVAQTINSTGGHLAMAGGTVAAVVTDVNSTVSGGGTIAGDAFISGVLAPGLNNLTFQGSISMNSNSMFAFTLGSLVDDSSGTAGVDWSLFTFDLGAGDTSDLNGFSFENDFDLIASTLPNSGDAFWDSDHSWLLIQSTKAFNANGNTFDPSWGFPTYEQGYFQWDTATSSTGPYEHTLTMYYYAVPEPSTWVLLGVGLGLMAWTGYLRRKP